MCVSVCVYKKIFTVAASCEIQYGKFNEEHAVVVHMRPVLLGGLYLAHCSVALWAQLKSLSLHMSFHVYVFPKM